MEDDQYGGPKNDEAPFDEEASIPKLTVEDRVTRIEDVMRQHFGPHTIPTPAMEEDAAAQAQTQAAGAARRGRVGNRPQ